jgi:aspartate aminotransferase
MSSVSPAGAFYAYPNIGRLLGLPTDGLELRRPTVVSRAGIRTPLEFSTRLLHEAGVVTVPGEAFGTEAHVRFSYATSIENLEKGLDRVTKFCAKLQ